VQPKKTIISPFRCFLVLREAGPRTRRQKGAEFAGKITEGSVTRNELADGTVNLEDMRLPGGG
jgi:hypothetical protein